MNKDIFEGKWKEMRGQAKEWWGKLTDDDLEKAEGKSDQIVGLLQQKYGYTREHAEEGIQSASERSEVRRSIKCFGRSAVVLVILWLLGLLGHVGGSLIHILLVIALIVIVFNSLKAGAGSNLNLLVPVPWKEMRSQVKEWWCKLTDDDRTQNG